MARFNILSILTLFLFINYSESFLSQSSTHSDLNDVQLLQQYTKLDVNDERAYKRLKRATGDPPLPGRVRSNSYAPGMDIRINSPTLGRNILIPKPATAMDILDGIEKRETVYRTEADPNRRLDSQGVIYKVNKKGNEPMTHVGIASDPKRTEDFGEQSRQRETRKQLKDARDFSSSLHRMLVPIDYKERVKGGAHDYMAEFRKGVKEMKYDAFHANGQTIRTSSISHGLASDIILGSVRQNLNVLSPMDKKLGLTLDVQNVDITKAHNQFGVKGETLKKLREEIAQSGVREGTAYGERRRSLPNIQLPNFFSHTPSTANTRSPHQSTKNLRKPVITPILSRRNSVTSLIGSTSNARAMPMSRPNSLVQSGLNSPGFKSPTMTRRNSVTSLTSSIQTQNKLRRNSIG